MSTVAEFSCAAPSEPELAPYRAICRSAVLSLALAVLSLPFVAMAVISMRFQFGDAVPLGFMGAALALPALVLGWAGAATVRRYPSEYTGGRLARAGLFGGLVLFAAGTFASVYTYATEVPEGYDRVTFSDLQPDPDQPELPVSPQAIDLHGKKIFIKGYMHPGVASLGKVKHFILVNDFGTCCFGGQPKPTHMIEIYMPPEAQGVAYSTRSLKLTGTFFVSHEATASLGLAGVWYHLQVDSVK
jgi:hypothetical protein